MYCWNNKTWNKKSKTVDFSALLATLTVSLVQPVISSVVKGVNGRGVRRAGRGYIDQKFISCAPSFKQYRDY